MYAVVDHCVYVWHFAVYCLFPSALHLLMEGPARQQVRETQTSKHCMWDGVISFSTMGAIHFVAV